MYIRFVCGIFVCASHDCHQTTIIQYIKLYFMNIAIHLEHHHSCICVVPLFFKQTFFERLYPYLLCVFFCWSIDTCVHRHLYELHLYLFTIQMRTFARVWSFVFLALLHFTLHTFTHKCMHVLINLVLSVLIRLYACRSVPCYVLTL